MNYNIRNINKRIKRIKSFGLTPVTLKSPADIIEKIVNQKGTGTEGLIMTYQEAQFTALHERNEQLTLEDYNDSLRTFMEGYENQTYVQGAINEAYRVGKEIIKWIYNPEINKKLNDPYVSSIIERIDTLNKRELVKLLIDVGGTMEDLKKQKQETSGFVSKDNWWQIVDQWIGDIDK